MEQGPFKKTAAVPKKLKFAPTARARRAPKVEVKTEVVEETNAAEAQDLLRRFNENSGNLKPKFERKTAPVEVAFGYGGASTSLRSYGARNGMYQGGAHVSGMKQKKEYKEPWDYYSFYPVALPLRKPYLGDPEQLDEEEFGESSRTTTYDESLTKPASELGLMEQNLEARMFLLQLPPSFPKTKQDITVDGKKAPESSGPQDESSREKICGLDDLPAGLMGKMLVYKSGAVKLKLGDTIYNVSSGMGCVFAQDVAAINKVDKQCCVVGELSKRAIVTPDVDSVLDSMVD